MLTMDFLHGKYPSMIIVIVIAQCYGSKQTEPKGIAQGRGLFTNSHKSLAACAVIVIYPT